MIKFFRGLKANYAPSTTHQDGIYFATDTKELLMNNNAYGIPYSYDDSTLDGRLDTVEAAIQTLNGTSSDAGSVAYQIAQIVNDNNNGSIDTLNEIAAWIINDTTGAAKMASDISDLQTAVGNIDYSGKADKVASATSGNFAGLDANGNLTDSGKKASDFQAAGSYKTTQAAVANLAGSSIKTIKSLSQNANGVISYEMQDIASASASGAGLMSSSDFSKLAGIASNAQVNVIESISINGSAATISGKAVDLGSNYVQDASYVHTDSNFTSAEKTKLSGIATGAQVNVIETIKVGTVAQSVSDKTVTLGTAAGAATTDFDAAGAATTAESNAKSYADGLLAWVDVAAS